MNEHDELSSLRRAAREIFAEVLTQMNARESVLRALRFDGSRLSIGEDAFEVGRRGPKVFSVALGKAAAPMAAALDEMLGDSLAAGVVSTTPFDVKLSNRWRVFTGGHPLPNEASMEAAQTAFELLRTADERGALVVFLISGGGSALMELPHDPRITLDDLRETNRALVSCGARIGEINAVRRALSAVKGGGLSDEARRSPQLTLIISDTEPGREADVASGPTFGKTGGAPDALEICERYQLTPRIPRRVVRAIESSNIAGSAHENSRHDERARRRHVVLLDNARACEAAASSARARGFVTEVARDISEQDVREGAASMAERLYELRAREGRSVCLISGGEFACPVRGEGLGGRNAETALRCAFEFERRSGERLPGGGGFDVAALMAGTDGVDGNSPAAGALADRTTTERARRAGLNPERHLDESDAFTLFDVLGDAIVTGPTGTNVRDIRILLAR